MRLIHDRVDPQPRAFRRPLDLLRLRGIFRSWAFDLLKAAVHRKLETVQHAHRFRKHAQQDGFLDGEPRRGSGQRRG